MGNAKPTLNVDWSAEMSKRCILDPTVVDSRHNLNMSSHSEDRNHSENIDESEMGESEMISDGNVSDLDLNGEIFGEFLYDPINKSFRGELPPSRLTILDRVKNLVDEQEIVTARFTFEHKARSETIHTIQIGSRGLGEGTKSWVIISTRP